MNHVFFDPWIGKDYQNGIDGLKILVLGHSHVCGEKCKECGEVRLREECAFFTQNAVNSLLAWSRGEEGYNKWMKTYISFERALAGYALDHDSREKVWNSIAFYNYVQTAMDNPKMQPNESQYLAAEKAFPEVLQNLLPDVILAWGKAYDFAPGLEGHSLNPVDYEGYQAEGWEYTINGRAIRMYKIHHPSVSFSWEYWHVVIQMILKEYVHI